MEPYKFQTHQTETGFTLPSVHACPAFFCFQPFPASRADQDALWTRLILSYARHRRLFTLSADDAERQNSEWLDVLTNDRINRRLTKAQVTTLLQTLVSQNQAAYEPPKQDSAALIYWRKPEEWAETLHSWAVSTGQLNNILTFYEIQEPELPSELSGIPTPLLRRIIGILTKSNRAQMIDSAEGDGVRFFTGT
ncbi:hypothetical protein FRB91_005315 [Serendipita sp. 411]|nr:hypothetical protein FRB91_005315 [Serendipita sp. 411]